jgi:hypothetical protein
VREERRRSVVQDRRQIRPWLQERGDAKSAVEPIVLTGLTKRKAGIGWRAGETARVCVSSEKDSTIGARLQMEFSGRSDWSALGVNRAFFGVPGRGVDIQCESSIVAGHTQDCGARAAQSLVPQQMRWERGFRKLAAHNKLASSGTDDSGGSVLAHQSVAAAIAPWFQDAVMTSVGRE